MNSIGKTVRITGELTGNEDLCVDGRVDGHISLGQSTLTIDESAEVAAQIHAHAVVVRGRVRGTIDAENKVEISTTADLHGDVCSPRVVLADGAKFTGRVDMESKPGSRSPGRSNNEKHSPQGAAKR